MQALARGSAARGKIPDPWPPSEDAPFRGGVDRHELEREKKEQIRFVVI